MEVKKRLYTVDDLYELQGWDSTRDRKYELIDGELIEMPPSNVLHAWLASELATHLRNFAGSGNLGYAFVELGAYSITDRHTLRAPNVAFFSAERLSPPFPQTFVGLMPDLAVEIKSPSNTMAELREKAAWFLQHGTRLVWLVLPDRAAAEVCRQGDDGTVDYEFVGPDGSLSGEDVLPGFELELRLLFPPS